MVLLCMIFLSSCSIWSDSDSESRESTIIIEKPIIQIPEVLHQKTPENVKSIYFPAGAFLNSEKRKNLSELIKNKEINSVTLDIKTISGYTSFDFPLDEFWSIKPESNGKIQDIKEQLTQLHEEGIYVIGRIVIFKDARLADLRPDLAIKWKGSDAVWTDYKGKKYLDPAAPELVEYYTNLSTVAYELGFDEINFDYIRFPSDGLVSKTHYPFASEIITKNPKWWEIITIDRFASQVTQAIRERTPELQISADVFWLVTNTDLFQIGQNLESFLLYFDAVWPMIYPSHYGKGYLGYNVPDNAPYAIFNDSISRANKRIEKLNIDMKQATASGTIYEIKWIFAPSFNQTDFQDISPSKIRPWLQGFTCSRCRGATPYTRTKFREQIRGINENGQDSWWVWSAGGNYYPEWYDEENLQSQTGSLDQKLLEK